MVELWALAIMYHLEGLKFYYLASLKRNLYEKNDVSRIVGAAEDLSCPCDELRRFCLENFKRMNW